MRFCCDKSISPKILPQSPTICYAPADTDIILLADWQIALLIFTPFLFQEVFQSVLIYKDNFASSVELLTFAIIDVISKVLSKYLIERKTTE